MKCLVLSLLIISTASFVFSTSDSEEELRRWRESQASTKTDKNAKQPSETHEKSQQIKKVDGNSAQPNLKDEKQHPQPDLKDKEKQPINDEEKKDSTSQKKEKEPEPSKLLKVGNLAFPVAQQPTPLVSFGQNLIAQGQVEWQGIISDLQQKNGYFIDSSNSIIYAFKDNLSIYISQPIAIRFRQDHHHSFGTEDTLIQFEYAPYTKEYYTYYNQISIVANVTIPSGSLKKNPPTGTGTNSFFIGGVFSNMGINWFYFTSYGGIFNTTSHRTTYGNQFLYQYGVGRRIFSNSNWLFDWMLEMDGQYICRNKINGSIDPNSGGNIIYVTPSLFLSSKQDLVIQLGIGFPIAQQLFGHQPRRKYVLQTKISWNF